MSYWWSTKSQVSALSEQLTKSNPSLPTTLPFSKHNPTSTMPSLSKTAWSSAIETCQSLFPYSGQIIHPSSARRRPALHELDLLQRQEAQLRTVPFSTPVLQKCTWIIIKNEIIIGGGKKFMSQYDCVKNCVGRRFKEMNKRYISAVELVHQNLVVAGQFDGQLSFQDLRAE